LRCLEQVEEDLKKMKVRNWIEKCKDRRLWNEIVKQKPKPTKSCSANWRRRRKVVTHVPVPVATRTVPVVASSVIMITLVFSTARDIPTSELLQN